MGLALAVAGALTGSSRSARADASEAQLDLRWTAPVECPSRADELAEVSRILGEAKGTRRQVAAIATVTRDGSGWHATLSTRTSQGAGDRVLDAASCDAIGHAVALIVALAVDEQTEAPAPPTSEPSRSPAPPPIAGASQAPAAAVPSPAAPTATPVGNALQPPPRDRSPEAASAPPPPSFATRMFVPRLAVSWGVGADSATLPSPAPGSELSGGLLLASPRWVARAEGYVSYFPARTATAFRDPNEGGRFSLVSLGIRISGGAVFGRFAVGPCAGAEVDLMPVTAFGEVGTSTPGGEGAWGAMTGGGLASFALTRAITLRLRAEADVPLVRPRFVVEEANLASATFVHQPAPVSARVSMGAELDFF